MQNLKNIDRSKQNERDVIMTDVPKSGFNLTYSTHEGGLALGRIYPTTYQHLMPADKISGSNEASLIFEKLATPVVGDMDICQHNFLVTLRSIDNQWEKFMTPTKLNNMNASVSVPTFNLGNILNYQFKLLMDKLFVCDLQAGSIKLKLNPFVSLNMFKFNIGSLWNDVYHQDALYDLYEQLHAIIQPANANPSIIINTSMSSAAEAQLVLILNAFFDFFVGKRSLLDYFGYPIVTHKDIKAYIQPLKLAASSSTASGTPVGLYTILSSLTVTGGFTSRSYPDVNEYLLRAYYAIWFEYYRNFDLEPRSANLPEYRSFGASSIFTTTATDYTAAEVLHYLVPRIRSWQTDFFTSAGIDDISRHVFAPVTHADAGYDFSSNDSAGLVASNALANRLVQQELAWRNPSTGSVSAVNVNLPSNVYSQLVASTYTTNSDYALELFSLKKAQMLENFLKRIYYGGDEYRDRMLSLYGARIEDYRINRPKWLSSSLDAASPRQEVANTGIAPTNDDPDAMPIGGRVATATAAAQGSDGFTDFVPEFAVYIGLTSIMPRVTYNPLCYQNMQKKYTDFPIPQFANQMEDNIVTAEISRDSHNYSPFGFAPYGHAYRYRVDEVHGDYLDEKYDYVFSRFFGIDTTEIPKLNWQFIHCRPKLPMFVNSVLLDGQVYGDFKHNFLVERTLPVPVETV